MAKLWPALLLVCIAAFSYGQQSNSPVPTAVIKTSAGEFRCELYPQKAPLAVRIFAGLATGTQDWRDPDTKQVRHNTPLYKDTIFHRVIPGFMIQGGDPTGTGQGGPGFTFKDEISDLKFDRPGRLAMANYGKNTNGSQFFITEAAAPDLNGHYTIFGQCDNPALVKDIASRPRNRTTDRPLLPVFIKRIVIENYPQPAPKVGPTAAPQGSPSPGAHTP